MGSSDDPSVEAVEAEAFTVPTDAPESDGTLEWSETSLCLVRVKAAGEEGLGFAYTAPAAAAFVTGKLAEVVRGMDALSPPGAWHAMRHEVRNVGRPGLVSSALSAVDVALWDLKARLLGVPLVTLLGRVHEGVPAYGSGGFTSYGPDKVAEQLGGWAEEGLWMVKMKVGRDQDEDMERVSAARRAIGEDVQLFVDANGAYSRKEALYWTWAFFEEWGIAWMEEPVSSDDRAGLRLVRDQGPPGVEIAAGEYGWDLFDLKGLLEAGAVDTLQVDVTRCGGITPVPGRRRPVRGLQHAPFGTHRALPPHTGDVRHGAHRAPGVVPRPRPHRRHAVRRRALPPGGRALPQHRRARPRAHPEGEGRRALPRAARLRPTTTGRRPPRKEQGWLRHGTRWRGRRGSRER